MGGVSSSAWAEPENPRCAEVFIRYARDEDGAQACAIADELERAGTTVWIAERSIAGAQNYALEIVDAIDACQAVVILCSAASKDSTHVPIEMELAFETGKPRLSLMLEPTELTNQLRYWLAGASRIDVSGAVDQWRPTVLHALALLGVSVRAPTLPSETVVLQHEEVLDALRHATPPPSKATSVSPTDPERPPRR